MNSKTFLHICLSEGWGGLEMAVIRWNQVLKENGHQNINICTPDSPLAKQLRDEKFESHEWENTHYFSPDFSYKLNQLLKNRKIDAAVLQNLRELWIVSPAFWGIKRTQLIGFAQMLLGVRKKDFLHQLVYKRLDHALTLTDWQQGALEPYLPIPMHKYKTIPNFVDCRIFKPELRSDEFRYRLGYSQEDFVIGIIGRIDQKKGQQELLQAFNKVADAYGNLKLLIVGEATVNEIEQQKYYQELKSTAEQSKHRKKIRFMGFQKQPEKIMANLDLFVLASYAETFGYVVVEAMASGTPVIGTLAGGVPEILQQGELGYLCQPKNSQDLANQIKKVLDDVPTKKHKTAKALSRARDFYDRQKVYERFIEIIS